MTEHFNKKSWRIRHLQLKEPLTRPVLKNEWSLSRMEEKNKDVKFLDIAPVN
jgi:hypothetical protein